MMKESETVRVKHDAHNHRKQDHDRTKARHDAILMRSHPDPKPKRFTQMSIFFAKEDGTKDI